MNKLAAMMIVMSSLLSGCIVYDGPRHDGGYRGDHNGQPGRGDHDRDRDGVRDSQDRKPGNPNRY